MNTTTTSMLTGFDALEIEEDTIGYSTEDHGKLALQNHGAFVTFCDTIGEAEATILDMTGIDVTATRAANYFSGARWTFKAV